MHPTRHLKFEMYSSNACRAFHPFRRLSDYHRASVSHGPDSESKVDGVLITVTYKKTKNLDL